ncbi:MAG: hypothetical protein ABSC22_07880 [Roseiarcus sp.]|jgi:hypothetical protein
MIALLAAATCCALAPAGHAAGQARLPIAIGDYYSDSADDCGGPAAMAWDGRAFVADYVYIDNIVSINKIGENQYDVASRTKTRDENTQQYGYLWRARIEVVDKGQFVFNQYADKEKYQPADARTYHLCPK